MKQRKKKRKEKEKFFFVKFDTFEGIQSEVSILVCPKKLQYFGKNSSFTVGIKLPLYILMEAFLSV